MVYFMVSCIHLKHIFLEGILNSKVLLTRHCYDSFDSTWKIKANCILIPKLMYFKYSVSA